MFSKIAVFITADASLTTNSSLLRWFLHSQGTAADAAYFTPFFILLDRKVCEGYYVRILEVWGPAASSPNPRLVLRVWWHGLPPSIWLMYAV